MHDACSFLSNLDIFGEAEDANVINAREQFQRKYIANRHRWQLTPKHIQQIVDYIF